MEINTSMAHAVPAGSCGLGQQAGTRPSRVPQTAWFSRRTPDHPPTPRLGCRLHSDRSGLPPQRRESHPAAQPPAAHPLPVSSCGATVTQCERLNAVPSVSGNQPLHSRIGGSRRKRSRIGVLAASVDREQRGPRDAAGDAAVLSSTERQCPRAPTAPAAPRYASVLGKHC